MDEQEKIELAARGELPAEFTSSPEQGILSPERGITEEIAHTARYNLYAAAFSTILKRSCVNEHVLRIKYHPRGQDSIAVLLAKQNRIPPQCITVDMLKKPDFLLAIARTVSLHGPGKDKGFVARFPEGSLRFLALKRFRKPANEIKRLLELVREVLEEGAK